MFTKCTFIEMKLTSMHTLDIGELVDERNPIKKDSQNMLRLPMLKELNISFKNNYIGQFQYYIYNKPYQYWNNEYWADDTLGD